MLSHILKVPVELEREHALRGIAQNGIPTQRPSLFMMCFNCASSVLMHCLTIVRVCQETIKSAQLGNQVNFEHVSNYFFIFQVF